MSYTDAVARVAQIQAESAAVQSAFERRGPSSTSFSETLARAHASGFASPTPAAGASPSIGQAPLTTGQREFASVLAARTGLDPKVISAWLLAEESGEASQARQAANNNDWLNIGYTDSGTYGSADSIWSNPVTAAEATAGWLSGHSTIAGYGTASPGVQAILQSAGQPAQAQIAAIQQSGWASSGYPDLPSLYQQVVA